MKKELSENEGQQERVKEGECVFQKSRRQAGTGSDRVTGASEGCVS